MASHLLTAHRSFRSGCGLAFKRKLLPNPFVNSYISTFPLPKSCHFLKLERSITRASSDGVPAELVEDSKFVPLHAEGPRYGPPIIFCTQEMINGSLWEAVNTKQQNLEVVEISKSLPRICILSGLTGEEMMMFIDAFPESGLETPVFAAHVPNSADKPVKELIEEIMGDHEMMGMRNQSG